MSSEQKKSSPGHPSLLRGEIICWGLIDALGRIGDARAVEPLIALLDEDEYPPRTQWEVRGALTRIGETAIEALLKVVLDPGGDLKRICPALEIIKSIGACRKDVSDALEKLLQPERPLPARLRRQSLYVAAHLRDVRQTPYAVAALSSDDWQTVKGAAQFLIQIPAADALPDLQKTLEQWTSPEKNPFDRKYVQQPVVAAILEAEQAAVTESIKRILEQSARESGPLDSENAVEIMCKQGLPGHRTFLLKHLVEGLDQSQTHFPVGYIINIDIITFLAASWHPQHLDELNAAVLEMEAQDMGVAAKLVNVAEGMKPDEDTDNQLPGKCTVYTLAKARATNFVPEASRLLKDANQWLSEHICEALWVANDSRAEEALILKFDQALADKNLDHLREPIVQALGTCGTERGGEAVLAFLRSDEFHIYMPPETLPTLVRRGWLNQKHLSEIARDTQLNPRGRTECVVALGNLDAKGNKDLFHDLMFEEGKAQPRGEELLRRAAVIMLGSVEDQEAISELRRLLRTTESPSIALQTAQTLARRAVHEAIPDIQYALEKFGTSTRSASRFATVLARLGDTSRLPVVIEAFYESLPGDSAITEGLSVFLPDKRAERVILEQLETSRGMYRDIGEQVPAVRALARYNPNLLLNHVLRLHRAGRFDPTARLELAERMHILSGVSGIDKGALIEAFKMLVCDWYLPARERALYALGWAGSAICNQVYEGLKHAADDWTRACAVGTLWLHGDDDALHSARFDGSAFVRASADAALKMRHRRTGLEPLIELYKSKDDLVRLSAYLSIKDAGDEIIIWTLDKVIGRERFERIFLPELADLVIDRIKKAREQRERENKKYLNSSGEIRFDSTSPF